MTVNTEKQAVSLGECGQKVPPGRFSSGPGLPGLPWAVGPVPGSVAATGDAGGKRHRPGQPAQSTPRRAGGFKPPVCLPRPV